MDAEQWRQWAAAAPEWAFQFFADQEVDCLAGIASRRAPIGELGELLELIREDEARVTIVIEPTEGV